MMLKKVAMIGILLLMAAGFGYAAVSLGKYSTAAEVGDPAPEFTLENMEGEMISLSDFSGTFVILNFFTTWCDPCREEAPEIEAFEERYGDQVKVLIMDRGEPKVTVAEFIKEFETTSTYLLDYDIEYSRPYGVVGQPETFFIDEDGIIRYHKIGPMTTEFMVKMVNKFRNTPLK